MKRIILIGSGVIIVLAFFLFAALYMLTGITKTSEIKSGVFQVYNENVGGRIGANMTLFQTAKGLVCVDSHLAPLAARARKKIAQTSKSAIVAVFNTHWHPDHIGGNGAFTNEAEIISHINTHSILSSEREGYGLTKPGSKHEFDPVTPNALPEILVSSDQTFTKYGSIFQAVHYPNAHTDGDLVIYAPEYHVVVLGDLIWPNSFPFIDVHNGGTAPGLRNALTDIIAATDETHIFAVGHGAPIRRADVIAYLEMISASIEFVEFEKSNGTTLKAMQQLETPEALIGWGSKLVPTSEWIRMIYETI